MPVRRGLDSAAPRRAVRIGAGCGWRGAGMVLLAIGLVCPDGVLFLAGWVWLDRGGPFVLRQPGGMEYHARSGSAQQRVRRSRTRDGWLDRGRSDELGHRRFRAEIFRLAGQLDRAIDDYQSIVARDPDSPVGLAGLAETYAQSGDFETARRYAQQAHERDPGQWMGAYNLGLIEDRLGLAAEAIQHLERALDLGVPQSRYRLLTRLWLARNYARQGQPDAARAQLDLLREQTAGLRDWQIVFESAAGRPQRTCGGGCCWRKRSSR